jgi:protein-L-isoaspartate(D-aspartate) O-methyltransferase
LKRVATKLLDVHLMIDAPDRYIDDFVAAGADMVSVHVEAVPHLHRTITHIRKLGARAGAVLNPATPAVMLEDIAGDPAAILAKLGASVTSIERHPDLSEAARDRLRVLGVEGIDLRVGDGSQGAPDGAPRDGIVVTAAAPAIPDALREQLAIGARLVIPVGPRYQQDLIVVERKTATEWNELSDGAVVFVPLVGEGGFRE